MPKRSKSPKLPPKEIIDSYFDELYEAITQEKHLTKETARFFRNHLRAIEKRKKHLKQHQPRIRLDVRNCLIIVLIERLKQQQPEAKQYEIFEQVSNYTATSLDDNGDVLTKRLGLSEDSIKKIYDAREKYLYDEWVDASEEQLSSLLYFYTRS